MIAPITDQAYPGHQRIGVLAAVILLTFLMKSSPLGVAPILLLLVFLIWVAYKERTSRRNLDRAERIFTP